MQIRCTQCHRPFGLTKEVVHQALDKLEAEGLGYYNAQCPHCRRLNKVSKDELLHSAPDYKRKTVQG